MVQNVPSGDRILECQGRSLRISAAGLYQVIEGKLKIRWKYDEDQRLTSKTSGLFECYTNFR